MSATKNQIGVYQLNETVRLDVRSENETGWLMQERRECGKGKKATFAAEVVG